MMRTAGLILAFAAAIAPGLTHPVAASAVADGQTTSSDALTSLTSGTTFAPLPPPVTSATAPSPVIVYPQPGSQPTAATPQSAAAAANPIRWAGGYVQHYSHIYVVFWGKEWNSFPGEKEHLLNFYRWLGGTSYADILTQYFDHQGSISGGAELVSSFTDARLINGKEYPTGMGFGAIKSEAEWAIETKGWARNAYENIYVVATPPRSSTNSELAGACGFHTWEGVPWQSVISAVFDIYGCGGQELWQGMQGTAAHEWAEAATDPIPYEQYIGWANPGYGEVADLCGGPNELVKINSEIWVARLFDDYLNAATGQDCVAEDANPGRFSVQSASGSTSAPHEATLSGSVTPAGYPASYQFHVTGPNGYSATVPAALQGIGSSFGAVPVSGTISGLRGSSEYTVTLSTTDQLTESEVTGQTSVLTSESRFTTPDWRPISTTEPATEVKAHTATLHGNVNPQGADTHYQFEYGTTPAYGSVVPIPAGDIGAGNAGVPVSAAISGLEVGTFYHYRVTATNEEGTTYGADSQFETPNKPVVTAEAPLYVNTLEPTMDATISPERADTHYQFEYGTTKLYGTTVPIPAEDIGAGAAVMVERGLKGLQRSTTYDYRVTAENEVGVVHGANKFFTTLPPCKGAEQKCVWSLQEPSNPLPPSKFEMKGVFCSSATLCVAVGKNLYNSRSFVDRWNGSAWTLLSGAVPGEMRHIACVGSGCFAVGVSGGVATTWAVSEYPVGGGTWIVAPVTTPIPAGSSETVLDGVSCTAEAACTAVGSYKGSEGTYHPLVERWNGSAWSLQSAPNPSEGTAQNAMLSVSCISIGCVTVGEAAGRPVAETWFSGSWATSSPKLPAGAKGGKLSSVSCTSSACIAVGESNEGLGTEKALAESFELLQWGLMSAPSPAGAKGFVELAAVSCPSAGACTAAGWYASAVNGGQPTELKTLAESLSGSSWTIQSSANSTQRYNLLADVSCSAAGACAAVGQDSEGFYAEPESLAERWNGSTWSTQKIVNPEEPLEDELKSVSCSTNTICVGAGRNVFAENGFAEVWNGTEWLVVASVAGEARKASCVSEGCIMVGTSGGSAKIWIVIRLNGIWGIQAMTVPLPAGSSESVLDGVSCTAEAACTAVGSYKGSEGTYHPLVERWNGSAWSLQSAPNPAEGTAQNAMLGVSCGGASSCMTVGEAAGRPVAETWNGSAWSPSSAPPLPAGAKGATLASVSCGSTKACMAVGASNEGVGTEKALTERWGGGAWSIVPAPAPAGAKGFVDLTDVACLSPNACFSAGYYAPELVGGNPVSLKTLVESWEGTEWTVLTTPNLASQTYNALAGISCSTSIDCTAVGGAASSITKRPPVQLVMRFE